MKKWLVVSVQCLVILFVLGACTKAREITLADGSKGYQINCHGVTQTMMDCLRRAGDECPAGYLVWDGRSEPQWYDAGYVTGSRKYPDAVDFGMTTTRRSILVFCREGRVASQ